MTNTNVKVAVWGFGAMGQGMTKMLLGKKGVEITGICCRNADRVGKTMFDVLQMKSEQPDVKIYENVNDAIAPKSCDVVLLCTDSFTAKAFEKLEVLAEKGLNVITIAEEMSYPQAQEPELAKKIDEMAKKNGISILGTGINPGLVMDLLAVLLSAAMTDVTKVMCKRVNSLSPFGPTVMREQGVGLTHEEFAQGIKDHTVAGHVGFAESVMMIAEGLGLEYDDFQTQMAPIGTDVDRTSPYGFAAAGNVAGVNMTAQGLKNGKVVIDMYHPQQIEPEQVGIDTGDYIELTGTPPISMAIKPEISGGLGTIAMGVNCIPQCINADPGLITMLDIPVPRAIMGDFRKLVKADKKIVK